MITLENYKEFDISFNNWKFYNNNILSEPFMREFQDQVDWRYISEHQKLSEPFIREFRDRVSWCWVFMYQKLSESFIREFQDKIDWKRISVFQKLSENFIREFNDEVYWDLVSIYQKLSESFIREFQSRVNWDYISAHQKLSESFIREFQDQVNWIYISEYQKLSEPFVREFNLKISKDNWLYASTEYKKEQIKRCGKYECFDDYFIAYKGIRSDRYSEYNFQYQYLKGETYDCHADYSDEENSFGLSVWNREQARNYCDELVVKVKVYYRDVARLVHSNNKIRCCKLEVLD